MSDLPQLTTNCYLNGKQYLLNLTVAKFSLNLILTNKTTFEKWKSTPTVEYIESMTRKTGNYKTFAVFSEMMKAVFLNASPSLSIKLLTQEELERLNDSTLKSKFPNNNMKRIYFILVYTSEFDRIHYPLPMDYAGLPNPEALQATIHGLETDKYKLLKELEMCKTKNDFAMQEDINSLKTSSFETAKRCSELGQQCQVMADEFRKLKEQIFEERELWRKELVQVKVDYDIKLNEIVADMKGLSCILNAHNDPNIYTNPRNRLRSPRRNVSGARGRTCAAMSSSHRLASRPSSPRSVSSFGSAKNDSARSITDQTLKFNKLNGRTNVERSQSGIFPGTSFSENDVDSMRVQIEALQRCILGLSSNLK